MWLIILKFICLSVGLTYGFGNIVKGFRGLSISTFQMWAMSIGIVGFIFLQFKLYL